LNGNGNSADYIYLVLETVHVAQVCSIVMKRGEGQDLEREWGVYQV